MRAPFGRLGGHSGGLDGPCGRFLGALGVIREASVDHVGAFWELQGAYLKQNSNKSSNIYIKNGERAFHTCRRLRMSSGRHSASLGGTFGLISGALGEPKGALGVIREASVDHVGAFWQPWRSFGRLRWTMWALFGSLRGHSGGLGGPCGCILGVAGSMPEAKQQEIIGDLY